MVAASMVADLAAQALSTQQQQQQQHQLQPPPPLPPGWLLKESRSQPGVFYYYDQETGQSYWDPPEIQTMSMEQQEEEEPQESAMPDTAPQQKQDPQQPAVKRESESSSGKRSRATSVKQETKHSQHPQQDEQPSKRQRKTPDEVRVLHILKKHKDSKRPSSWRSKRITISLEEAREELQGLLEILREEQGNPASLIATFKELASQESDCSSAKRKGDLGFFGRKKMRPEFEEAAFGLDVNELSGIVETASGAHILLRLE